MIKVGDLITIPYLYTDGEYGVGLVLAVEEGRVFGSKKIFTLWSAPDGGKPIKEWIDSSVIEVISQRKRQNK